MATRPEAGQSPRSTSKHGGVTLFCPHYVEEDQPSRSLKPSCSHFCSNNRHIVPGTCSTSATSCTVTTRAVRLWCCNISFVATPSKPASKKRARRRNKLFFIFSIFEIMVSNFVVLLCGDQLSFSVFFFLFFYFGVLWPFLSKWGRILNFLNFCGCFSLF